MLIPEPTQAKVVQTFRKISDREIFVDLLIFFGEHWRLFKRLEFRDAALSFENFEVCLH